MATARGWCLVDLGRPVLAADVLHAELSRIPDHADRARARWGARLAVALAESGEVEAACAAAKIVLATYDNTGSATIKVDLRRLAQVLRRWDTVPDVRRVLPELIARLRRS